jgi:filamentous hemagglutinin family protein
MTFAHQIKYAFTSSVSVLALGISVPAFANPADGVLEYGDAVIEAIDPQTLEVRQLSDRAVINWGNFDIGENETTRFVVPDASSITLNRDLSGDPSEIYGTLQSNGRLFLVNRSGILFGEGARVDVSGLVATTHDIRTDDFVGSRFEFNIPGDAGASVTNLGQVSVAELGFGAFVAPHVRNDGAIIANLGRVEMASANGFTLDLHGDRLISFLVENPNELGLVDADGNPVGALVENSGLISANGGQIALSASAARGVINQVINTDGIIEANTVAQQGGRIILGGGDTGVVQVSGEVSARGDNAGEAGGTIAATGEVLYAFETAFLDVSGVSDGGRLMFGGDYLGGRAEDERLFELGIERSNLILEPSQAVVLEAGARLVADAGDTGDGGVIIVWGDQAQYNYASHTATGGDLWGDGGFIETSAGYLSFAGLVDTTAPNGQAGTWLLDPIDITIDDVGSATQLQPPYLADWNLIDGGSYQAVSFAPAGTGSVVPVAAIEFALNTGNNVVITTFPSQTPAGSQRGDITLAADIRVTSGGGARLALLAGNDIEIERGVDVRSTGGPLIFELVALNGEIEGNNVGRIDLDGGELILQFRDGLDFTSTRDMPDVVTLIAQNSSLGNNRRRVEFRFDDDFGRFDYSANVANFYPGALDLRDRTASGHVNLIFANPVEARVQNLGVIWDNNHSWEALGFDTGGVESFNALDGIPEFVGGSTFLTFGSKPGRSLVPVFEVSDDVDETVDRYIVTAPAGQAILDAYLVGVERQTQTPIQQVVGQLEEIVADDEDTTSSIDGVDRSSELARIRDQVAAFPSLLSRASTAAELTNEVVSLISAWRRLSEFYDAEQLLRAVSSGDSWFTPRMAAEARLDRAEVNAIAALGKIVAKAAVSNLYSDPDHWIQRVPEPVMMSLMDTAVNAATLNISGQILDSSLAILSEYANLAGTTSALVNITLQSASTNLDALGQGAVSFEDAMNSAEFTRTLAEDLTSGRVTWRPTAVAARQMTIIAGLQELRAAEIQNLSFARKEEIRQQIIEMDGGRPIVLNGVGVLNDPLVTGATYRQFADSVARALGMTTWTNFVFTPA